MPFGLGKKGKQEEAADESSRSRLFGSRSSKTTAGPSTPASANPYAAQPSASTNPYAAQPSTSTPDPYAQPKDPYLSKPDPYAGRLNSSQGSLNTAGGRTQYTDLSRSTTSTTQPPAYNTGGYSNDNFRNDKSAAATGGYGGSNGARYNNQSNYSHQTGYGANNPYGESPSSQRPGGYGGLGRTPSQDTMATEAGRDALFGDARERAEKQAQQLPSENGQEDGGYGIENGHRGAGSGGYGGYGDRQLTVRVFPFPLIVFKTNHHGRPRNKRKRMSKAPKTRSA